MSVKMASSLALVRGGSAWPLWFVCCLQSLLFVANRTRETTGVAGKMIPGLILGELRSPDVDPIETRKKSVFEQKVRFVSGKHHHVVFEVPGDKEFVLKRYLFVGSLEGEILAEREGRYSSIGDIHAICWMVRFGG